METKKCFDLFFNSINQVNSSDYEWTWKNDRWNDFDFFSIHQPSKFVWLWVSVKNSTSKKKNQQQIPSAGIQIVSCLINFGYFDTSFLF